MHVSLIIPGVMSGAYVENATWFNYVKLGSGGVNAADDRANTEGADRRIQGVGLYIRPKAVGDDLDSPSSKRCSAMKFARTFKGGGDRYVERWFADSSRARPAR
jgi:hypothetical protein